MKHSAALARIVAVVGLLALSVGIGVHPAEATTPVLVAPERVYTGIDVPLLFTGTDPISGDDKAMQITAPSAGCDPLADGPDPGTDPDYALTNCARVQLDVGFGELAVGVQTLLNGPTQPDGIATGGAIIESSGNGDGTGLTINLNGTQTQLTDALATLVWTPPSGFEDTNNPVRYLGVLVVDGNSSDSVDKDIELRVEGINEIPSLTVGADQAVAANSTTQLPAVAPPSNTNGDFFMTDGDLDQGEIGDQALLVMFTTCGQYSLRGGSLTIENDLKNLLVNSGLDEAVADAVIAALPSEVTSLPFATSNPGDPKVAMAALGDLDEVNYALSQVSFYAPATAGSCQLFTIVSDLGNNGMPLQYVGSPIGGADQPQPGYELPLIVPQIGITTFTVDGGAVLSVPATLDVNEGDTLQIPLNISSANHPAFDVSLSATDVSTTTGADYDPPATPATYPQNAGGPVNVALSTKTDSDVEGDETLTVSIDILGQAPGVTTGNDLVTITIHDTTVTTTSSTSTTTTSSSTTVPDSSSSTTSSSTSTTTTSSSTTVPDSSSSTTSSSTSTTQPDTSSSTSTSLPTGSTTSTTPTGGTTTSTTTTPGTETTAPPSTDTTLPGSTVTTGPGDGVSGGGVDDGGGGVSGGGTALPRTGSDSGTAVTTGLALLAVGGGFVLAARRRRQLVLARVPR